MTGSIWDGCTEHDQQQYLAMVPNRYCGLVGTSVSGITEARVTTSKSLLAIWVVFDAM